MAKQKVNADLKDSIRTLLKTRSTARAVVAELLSQSQAKDHKALIADLRTRRGYAQSERLLMSATPSTIRSH